MSAFGYITDLMRSELADTQLVQPCGRVTQVLGSVIHAVVPQAKMGEVCLLQVPGSNTEVHAEVIGFAKGTVLLTPLTEIRGLSVHTAVIPSGHSHCIQVGHELVGRVLDGLGQPLDAAEKGPLLSTELYPVCRNAPDPLLRKKISKPLGLGVKAVDALITCGEGQRLGIFAAAGVGKSSLLGMLTKYAEVDITVVALIGERGREVREFLDDQLGDHKGRKIITVVATADKPAMQRARAAEVATTIAEYFREQGLSVLLLMDSLTRYARSLREIGLAAGEAPTRRGFPPSVFSSLQALLERAGQSDRGSITALYTVLMEADDVNEPVADEVRSIVDGHIILSRDIAASNQYPAIDVLGSLSRIMDAIVNPAHKANASNVRRLLSKYKEIEFLVKMGEYKVGADAESDIALEKIDSIKRFLTQDMKEYYSLDQTITLLNEVVK
ncbi:MAG: type III secretion protein N (ATPase) [Lentisphaeria bacterium]|jgi:type III secretion protein N (ATPase)